LRDETPTRRFKRPIPAVRPGCLYSPEFRVFTAWVAGFYEGPQRTLPAPWNLRAILAGLRRIPKIITKLTKTTLPRRIHRNGVSRKDIYDPILEFSVVQSEFSGNPLLHKYFTGDEKISGL